MSVETAGNLSTTPSRKNWTSSSIMAMLRRNAGLFGQQQTPEIRDILHFMSRLSFFDWPKDLVQKLFLSRTRRGDGKLATPVSYPLVPLMPREAPIALGEVFTPTQPRAGRRVLVGRRIELERVLSAMNDEAAHVVIYGERGRGKTSFTNLVVERLRRSGAIVGRYVCNAESDFNQIMHGLVNDLPGSLLGAELSAEVRLGARGCGAILPSLEVLPTDVAAIPDRIACSRLIFVVDEFDRVQDSATRTKLADTIKLLSDRGLRLLFLIVGVSDTLDRIIGQHPSIQRNITSLHLPLLDDAEIRDMLVSGASAAGVVFSHEAVEIVVSIARGMPYMMQLMGLRITQQTLTRGATETSMRDIQVAIEYLVSKGASDAAPRYAALIDSHPGLAESALRIAATAQQDRWGRCSTNHLAPDMEAFLLEAKIYDATPSAPRMFQPLDRPLIYHVLLLDALARLNQGPVCVSVMNLEKDKAHGD